MNVIDFAKENPHDLKYKDLYLQMQEDQLLTVKV